MKKLMIVGLALASFAMYSCSSDDGASATNPNDAAEQFANPTGKLSSSNKKEVAEAGLNANKSNGVSSIAGLSKGSTADFLSFSNRALNQADLQACYSGDENSYTVDWECAAPLILDGCTGSGETSGTYNTDDQFTEVHYNGFAINCPDFDYSCDGTINYSTAPGNTGYTCGNITCDINEINFTFDGCTNPEGHYLVRISGETFVIESVVTNNGCNGTVTVTVTDSDGSSSITCDIASHEGTSCTDADDVNTISNCVIN